MSVFGSLRATPWSGRPGWAYLQAFIAFVSAVGLGWLSVDLVLDLSAPFGLSGADRSLGLVLGALSCMLLLRGIIFAFFGRKTYATLLWYRGAYVAFVAAAMSGCIGVDLIFGPFDPNFGLPVDLVVGFALIAASYIPLEVGMSMTQALVRKRRDVKRGEPAKAKFWTYQRRKIDPWLASGGFVMCAVLGWLGAELVFGPFVLSGMLPVERNLGLAFGAAACMCLLEAIFQVRSTWDPLRR